MANYPVTKLVGVTLKLRKLNDKFAFMFDHFNLMFCRGWQRNVTKFKTHVQNRNFFYFCTFSTR